jgi:hypothetical protein
MRLRSDGALKRMALSPSANAIVEAQLIQHLACIEQDFDADALTYIGPIATGADDHIKDAIENRSRHKKRLVFILETNGGFAESTRRISDTLRHHYSVVEFLIPSHAMSAGTILAMSGDAIWMDYYSVLGPIDPQVQSQDGSHLIPALGYLIKYQELLAKANAGNAGGAELELLLNFDQGELYSYEQARALSVSLLEEWLVRYKFRNWTLTERRRRPVTRAMKKDRARRIAAILNDARRWNSHGIGINMAILKRDLKLKIDDFGAKSDVRQHVRAYHKLLLDYMGRMGQTSIVHTRDTYEELNWRFA